MQCLTLRSSFVRLLPVPTISPSRTYTHLPHKYNLLNLLYASSAVKQKSQHSSDSPDGNLLPLQCALCLHRCRTRNRLLQRFKLTPGSNVMSVKQF